MLVAMSSIEENKADGTATMLAHVCAILQWICNDVETCYHVMNCDLTSATSSSFAFLIVVLAWFNSCWILAGGGRLDEGVTVIELCTPNFPSTCTHHMEGSVCEASFMSSSTHCQSNTNNDTNTPIKNSKSKKKIKFITLDRTTTQCTSLRYLRICITLRARGSFVTQLFDIPPPAGHTLDQVNNCIRISNFFIHR